MGDQYYKTKTRINPRIDSNLIKIMKRHCKCEHLNEQDFIADAIAEKLKVPLNLNHMLDESYYAEYQIREIDNCIDKLQKQRKQLEEKL